MRRTESGRKGIIKTDAEEGKGKNGLGAQPVSATENSSKEEMEYKPGKWSE